MLCPTNFGSFVPGADIRPRGRSDEPFSNMLLENLAGIHDVLRVKRTPRPYYYGKPGEMVGLFLPMAGTWKPLRG